VPRPRLVVHTNFIIFSLFFFMSPTVDLPIPHFSAIVPGHSRLTQLFNNFSIQSESHVFTRDVQFCTLDNKEVNQLTSDLSSPIKQRNNNIDSGIPKQLSIILGQLI